MSPEIILSSWKGGAYSWSVMAPRRRRRGWPWNRRTETRYVPAGAYTGKISGYRALEDAIARAKQEIPSAAHVEFVLDGTVYHSRADVLAGNRG